jgi:hypothetical protein
LRRTTDPNTGVVLTDNTCTQAGCHSRTNAQNQVQVPAGQLDLTAVASDDQALHLRSYRELLFTDNQQEVTMGALQDTLGPVIVPPSMAAGNARGSTRFFNRFGTAGDRHAGMLAPAELRLLSEWLDIGAQYFNNPFDPAAPVN